jgi:integrase
MAKIIDILSDAKVRAAQPREKAYKLRDGGGLHLLVTPTGRRHWRFRYGHGQRENMLSLGSYPEVTLSGAREKALAARRLLVDGKDPAAEKQAERADQANTFEAVATEWLNQQTLADITRSKAEWMFGLVLPDIGSRPIADLEPADVLKTLRKIEAKGRHETAHRAKQRIGQVFRYAIATGRAKHDPTSALRGALKTPEVSNHASLTDPGRVGALLRAIDGYMGQPTTHAALRLAPLTFVRPGELRAAEWSEFNLDGKEATWRIPGERMKMGEQHLVPLSTQAVAVLRELAPLTGRGRYVFPSIRSAERPMSNNTVNAALRRLGYGSDEMTGHGFRSTASTLLNERNYHPDLIELQLAHAERNKVRAAYNKAQRLPERRKMMQAWANYLDELKASDKKAVAIKAKARA